MDHDRLFKELLTIFFIEFVKLFLPDVAPYIEPGSVEFLDKEIFTDVAAGERHEVDLLVKVRLRGFGDGYILIHVELQAKAQAGFPHRIFGYFARLDQSFAPLRVFPVALFTYDKPLRAEPDRYIVEFPWQRVLDFSFRTIQLNRMNWRDYVRNPNPVASALMTKMQIAPEDRPRVKLECLRMLVTLKLDKARATLISAFMEAYLRLTPAEMLVYNREVEQIEVNEREAVMQWTNEWIEQGKNSGLKEGLEQGLERGLNQGRQEGSRQIVLRQLRRRLGDESAELAGEISRLTESQVDSLAEALLDFRTVADWRAWLTSVLGS